MDKNKLNYVVFSDFQVYLINDTKGSPCQPIGYIKSTWLKKSSGKGTVDYYDNVVFDANHEKCEDNTFNFSGISCKIEQEDHWRTIRGSHGGVTLRVTITDKFGITVEREFEILANPSIRFKNIFEYLQLLNKYGGHSAVEKAQLVKNFIRK